MVIYILICVVVKDFSYRLSWGFVYRLISFGHFCKEYSKTAWSSFMLEVLCFFGLKHPLEFG